MLHASRSTLNWRRRPWALGVESWALARTLVDLVFVKLEPDYHILAAPAGLSFSATLVFETMVLRSRCHRCGDCCRSDGLRLKSDSRPQGAGQNVRPKQARTNGIGQRNPRS